MNGTFDKRLVVIAGPTAAGKSTFALARAIRDNGVVINADASQVYADLRVLSARPGADDEAAAPHRLYGVIDGAQACSAAHWAMLARAEIDAAHGAGRLPIIVGGTGLYIRTLLHGIAPVPEIDPSIRDEARGFDAATAFAALSVEDPALAARLKPADRQRVARGLEVVRATGRSLLDWQAHNEGALPADIAVEPWVVDLPRDRLYARCDARFEAMLAGGALNEVAALVARGLAPDLPVMKALGVPPLAALLRGEIDRATAKAMAQRDTRNYAKRQQTWFRNQTSEWPRHATSQR